MSYTGIVIHPDFILEELVINIAKHFAVPAEYTVLAHHVTLNMGEPNEHSAPFLDRTCGVHVDAYGQIEGRVVAARVSKAWILGTGIEVTGVNNPLHITTHVNRVIGVKPKEALKITNWHVLPKHLLLTGTIKACG